MNTGYVAGAAAIPLYTAPVNGGAGRLPAEHYLSMTTRDAEIIRLLKVAERRALRSTT